MAVQIVITEHAGWPERRKGILIPGLHEVPSAGESVSVVSLENGELHAVPSRNVFTPEGLRYAEEWATKQGVSLFEVYIPEALKVR